MPTPSSQVRFVNNGEPASAGVFNRPTGEIYEILRTLQDRMAALGVGQRISIQDVPVAAAVSDGMPVYWDSSYSEFRPALDAVATTGGRMVPAPSARVAGIAWNRTTGNRAELVIAGYLDTDLSGIVVGPLRNSYLFLSAALAGRIECRDGSVGVLLGQYTDGKFLINPRLRAHAAEHEHLAFDLTCRPAGTHTPPAPGNPHVITDADPSLSGWLPADHPVFEGRAPAQAVFGYNIARDPSLAAAWPPVPPENARLTWYRDLTPDLGGAGFAMDGPELYYIINADGIWWLRDAPGVVPWPENLTTVDGVGGSSFILGSPDQPETDTGEWMSMTLYTIMPVGVTSGAYVTRLRMPARSVLKYYDIDGNVADTGDLCGRFDWSQRIASTAERGSIAVKSLDADGNFLAGPMVETVRVEGLLAASSDRAIVEGGRTLHRGNVVLSARLDPTGRLMRPIIVRPNGAEESYYSYLPTNEFPEGKISSVIYTFQAFGPEWIQPGTSARLRLRVVGRVTGTLPPLSVRLNVVAPPPPGGQSLVPDSPIALPIATSLGITAGWQREFASDEFTINPDEHLVIEVIRSGPDGYSGGVMVYDAAVEIGL